MAFCKNCGMALSSDSFFCQRCGTRIDPTAPVVRKSRGLGFAIPSLILGILGLALALVIFVVVCTDIESVADDSPLMILSIVYSCISLLSIIFAATARKRGSTGGLSMTGLILGTIGAIIFLIKILRMIIYWL